MSFNIPLIEVGTKTGLTVITVFQWLFVFIGVGGMVFNGTFNNISDISWRSVLLVEETGVPGKNH